MTRVALITTTINNPRNLIEWAATMNSDEDIIIISGDLKSPHEDIKKTCIEIKELTGVNARYFSNDRTVTPWESEEAIGANSIQRRNIALLEALTQKPEVIVTVDDDNYPQHKDQVNVYYDIIAHSDSETLQSSINGWLNVGCAYRPELFHRGYPLNMMHSVPGSHIKYNYTYNVSIGVFSSLWLGDPDINAIERIQTNRVTHEYELVSDTTTLDIGTWCPFNSQATAFKAELSPLMMMWPGVGRFDDIWASYAMRAVMDYIGLHVQYGIPLVHQDRNEHDLLRDLKDEMFGYEYTPELTKVMRECVFKNKSKTHFDIISLAEQLYKHVVEQFGALTPKTKNAFTAWTEDMRHLASNYGVNFMIKR